MPKGIKGFQKGVATPGAGRKSWYQEKLDAEWLKEFFIKEHTEDEIREMLKGNRSVSKQMLAKALAGNERYTLGVFNKLFPDNLNLNMGGRLIVSDEDKKKVLDLFRGENNRNTTETPEVNDKGAEKDSN